MTAAQPYIPAGGLAGKLRRLRARAGPRRMQPARLQRGMVSFSFDDFPKSAVDVGAAELERVQARGTYYASASFAGLDTHHGRMFDMDDLARLQAAGHEIGNHTYSHLDCARAPAEDVVADVKRNAEALRAMGCAAPLRSFAWPYGEASPEAKRALEPEFDTLRGVRPCAVTRAADLNLLPAHSLDGGEDGLARVLAALREAARRPSWLIVFAHDVQPRPTQWGCTPSMLRLALETARKLDLDIVTVGEGAQRLRAA